jgi:cytidylate kinase
MPGTRQDVFETVDQWLAGTDEPTIPWIQGPPGSGKSAIASSLASRFERGQLGSLFPFKREDVTFSDPTVVWRTMAHDLSLAMLNISFMRSRTRRSILLDPK